MKNSDFAISPDSVSMRPCRRFTMSWLSAARFVFSPGSRDRSNNSSFGGSGARFAESQVARRYAVRHGVPVNAIMIETVSRNTRENLREAAALMRQRKMTRAIVVSDPLHMSRALRLCREVGIECLGSSTPTSRYRSFATQWRFLLAEVYFFHRDLFPRRE